MSVVALAAPQQNVRKAIDVVLMKIYPEFQKWPSEWMESTRDIEYGKKIVAVMEPFIKGLIDKGLAKSTLNKHLSNLSWFGKKLMHEVNLNETYDEDVCDLILENLDVDGKICRQATESEVVSFEPTRWIFFGYLLLKCEQGN